METSAKKPFRQLYADENDELFKTLIQDPLLWAVYTICAIRARRLKVASPEGLQQGEFWLSETEYQKFGLKRSQSGQLRRRLQKLVQLKLILKQERRLENDGATIYRLTSDEPININPETENASENEQRTNRERTEINNNDKNEKKVNKSQPEAVKDISFKRVETGGVFNSESASERTGLESVGRYLQQRGINPHKPNPIAKWQDDAARIAKKLGIESPSPSWFKLFKKAWAGNQQSALQLAAAYLIDAPGVKDPEKLFFWKLYQILKGRKP